MGIFSQVVIRSENYLITATPSPSSGFDPVPGPLQSTSVPAGPDVSTRSRFSGLSSSQAPGLGWLVFVLELVVVGDGSDIVVVVAVADDGDAVVVAVVVVAGVRMTAAAGEPFADRNTISTQLELGGMSCARRNASLLRRV